MVQLGGLPAAELVGWHVLNQMMIDFSQYQTGVKGPLLNNGPSIRN
jgi:hypothetical protein